MLCKFSRLLFACAPLLLVAVALVPAAPADANICNRSYQVQSAIMAELRNLGYYNVRCGGVTAWALDSITKLDGFYLYTTDAGTLQARDFIGMKRLKVLNLSYSKLKSLPEGVFDGLSKLRELNLDNNELRSLPEGVFDGLSKLRKLNLDKNELKSLPEGVFSGLRGLKELRLSNNQLKRLPKRVFSSLNIKKNLHLDGNPGADSGWIWIDGELGKEVIPDLNPPPVDASDDDSLRSTTPVNLGDEIAEAARLDESLRRTGELVSQHFNERAANKALGRNQVTKVGELATESISNGNRPTSVGKGYERGAVKNYGTSDDLIELLKKIKPARPNNKKWLFVIGAEDYKNTDSIVYSRRSAERFAEVASKVFGIKPNRRVVLLEDATGGAIEDQLKAMLRKVRRGESIYFYYSGHGIPIRNSATRENTPYMLAIDHEPSLIEEKAFYNLNNIYDILNESQASKVLVILDSCFSGSTDGKSVLKGVGATMLIPDLPLLNREGKMAVITAGTDNEYSNALPAKQHRLFSYYLMRALLTGKYRNIGDLHATVYDAVVEESRNLGGTNRQTPQLQGNPNLTF